MLYVPAARVDAAATRDGSPDRAACANRSTTRSAGAKSPAFRVVIPTSLSSWTSGPLLGNELPAVFLGAPPGNLFEPKRRARAHGATREGARAPRDRRGSHASSLEAWGCWYYDAPLGLSCGSSGGMVGACILGGQAKSKRCSAALVDPAASTSTRSRPPSHSGTWRPESPCG
jgi:hypothetical protein